MLNRGPDSLWSLKIPGCPSNKSRSVTPASWSNSPIGLCPSSWPPNHPNIYWLASSLFLLSTNKLVCGGHSGAIWLPSHHPGRFECPEKRYINVKNYYYYYFYFFLRSQKHCRCMLRRCVNPHGLLFMLLFAHIKLKPWKKLHSNLTG